jgi:uncharacterized membrane protein
MNAFPRFLLLLSLIVWVGGIIFFSFVVAPALFALLSSPAIAGTIVSRSLTALHCVGIACGAIFLAATFLTALKHAKPMRVLIALMLLATVLSQFGVAPQMHRIRQTVGGSIEALPKQDAGRAAFDKLHQISVILEGATLLMGLAVVAFLSKEQNQP